MPKLQTMNFRKGYISCCDFMQLAYGSSKGTKESKCGRWLQKDVSNLDHKLLTMHSSQQKHSIYCTLGCEEVEFLC